MIEADSKANWNLPFFVSYLKTKLDMIDFIEKLNAFP